MVLIDRSLLPIADAGNHSSPVFMPWRLRRDPFREKVLLVGATADKAIEISTFMLRLVRDIDVLMHCGRCLMAVDPSTHGTWDRQSLIRSPASADGGHPPASLTGKRCTVAIGDDIETLSNSITVLKQERLAAAITELEAIPQTSVEGELPGEPSSWAPRTGKSSLYLRLRRNELSGPDVARPLSRPQIRGLGCL